MSENDKMTNSDNPTDLSQETAVVTEMLSLDSPPSSRSGSPAQEVLAQEEIPAPPPSARTQEISTTSLSGVHLTAGIVPERPNEVFEDGPSQYVSISHRFSSLNRAIEAVYQTDVVLVHGRFPSALLDGVTRDKYTRHFEPVGHYLPNLAYCEEEKVHFFTPKKWLTIGYKEKSFKLVDGTEPLRKGGWVRYKSLNGKFLDIFVKDGPEFLLIEGAPYLSGMTIPAFKCGMDIQTLTSAVDLCAKAANPSRLFARSVRFAGGVGKLSVLYHTLPNLQDIGGSEDAKEFLRLNGGDCNLRYSGTAGSYLEACRILYATVQDRYPDEASSEPLKGALDLLMATTQEEVAKQIYEAITAALPIFDVENSDDSHYFRNEGEEEDAHVMHTEVCIAGTPQDLEVICREEYKPPFPLFAAPETATAELIEMMSVSTYLLQSHVKLYRASIYGETVVLAPSTTPRTVDKDRGLSVSGMTWYEKMDAIFQYHGMIFIAGTKATEKEIRWVMSLNTGLIEHFLRFGPCHPAPVAHRLREPLSAALVPPPAYASGFGIRGDELVLSPYISNMNVWRRFGLCDSRAHLPSQECLKVLTDKRFRFTNAYEFLHGNGPLILEVTIESKTAQFPVSSSIRLFPEEKEIGKMVTYGETGVKAEDPPPEKPTTASTRTSTLPRLKFLPAVDTESADGTNPLRRANGTDDWGMSFDPSFPGNLVTSKNAALPFGQSPGYSTRFSMLPTWLDAWKAMRAGLISEEQLRNAYTICYCAAHSLYNHPAVQYYNPNFVASLTDARIDKVWWSYPTKNVTINQYFQVDDEGHLPLPPKVAEAAEASRKRKENQTRFWSERGGGTHAPPAPPHRETPRPVRGRGGPPAPGVGRGSNSRSTTTLPPLSKGAGRNIFQHPATSGGERTRTAEPLEGDPSAIARRETRF